MVSETINGKERERKKKRKRETVVITRKQTDTFLVFYILILWYIFSFIHHILSK